MERNLIPIAGVKHSLVSHQFTTAETRAFGLSSLETSPEIQKIIESLPDDFQELKEQINNLPIFKILILKLTRILELEA